MSGWAKAAPADVVATAAGELAGTTTSATYGAPYNHALGGQSVLGLNRCRSGAASASRSTPPTSSWHRSAAPATPATAALATWDALPATAPDVGATAYADALAKAPDGDPAQVPPGATGRCRC